jgi:hypothetical protein
MVSQKMFGIIEQRCKQATGKLTIPFGGKNAYL